MNTKNLSESCISLPYEMQGFELPSGRYLPDFLIDAGESVKLWIEVKPTEPTKSEKLRIRELAISTGIPVLVVVGDPQNDYAVCRDVIRCHVWVGDPRGVAFEILGRDAGHEVVLSAIAAFRSARFEYGECGAT